MVPATLLYVLTFLLFLTIPGSITGSIFLVSVVIYAITTAWRWDDDGRSDVD